MSDRPDEWFPRFARWMQESLWISDWPLAGTAYWTELHKLFADRRVTQHEATQIVREMFAGSVPVRFAAEVPPAFVARLSGVRNEEAARKRQALAESPAETIASKEHQRICEETWATLTDECREEWRDLVRQRMPSFARRKRALELLAMAWCTFPADLPERQPEAVDFGPPLKHAEPAAVRRVFEHDRILDGPPPTPAHPETPDESTPD